MGRPTMFDRPTTTASFPPIVPASQEHLDHAFGGARHQDVGIARGQTPHVHRMKAVHVLVRVDGEQHRALGDVIGDGKLDQDPVDGGIGVQPLNHTE